MSAVSLRHVLGMCLFSVSWHELGMCLLFSFIVACAGNMFAVCFFMA